MDRREQNGRDMAATLRLDRAGSLWIVPSRTGNGRYTVDRGAGTCKCPDYELRRRRCKHLWAVEFALCAKQTNSAMRAKRPIETLTVSKQSELPTARTGPRTTPRRQRRKPRL